MNENKINVDWDMCTFRATCEIHKLEYDKIFERIEYKQDEMDKYIKKHMIDEEIHHRKVSDALIKNTVTSGWVIKIGTFLLMTMLSTGAYMLSRVETNEKSIVTLDKEHTKNSGTIMQDIAVIKQILKGE